MSSRTPFIYGSSLTRDAPMTRRKRNLGRKAKTLGKGKKTNRWSYVRQAKLKPAFLRAGIVFCELRFEGCWVSEGLGFAHLLKRRHCSDDDLHVVVLCCNHCHDIVELQGEAMMNRILQKVINAREVAVVL